jgi:cell division protease FtsH
VTQTKQVSDETAAAIDQEVRRVIESNYQRARDILTTNIDKLHAMAEALVKFETIDEGQIKDIMAGRPPSAPSGWDDSVQGGPKDGSQGSDARPAPQPDIGSPAGEGSAG